LTAKDEAATGFNEHDDCLQIVQTDQALVGFWMPAFCNSGAAPAVKPVNLQ